MKILVVDDGPEMRDLLQLILESAGHEVRQADSCRLALLCQRRFAAQVVVIDMGVPDGGSVALVNSLAQLPVRPGVVLTSGLGGFESTHLAPFIRQLQNNQFLRKPFSAGCLLSAISTASENPLRGRS